MDHKEKCRNRLEEIEDALRGLGALFLKAGEEPLLNKRELSGLGCLLQIISREAKLIKNALATEVFEFDDEE